MSFKLYNSLLNYDDNHQPYSIEVERDVFYTHLNGKSNERGYGLTFAGAKAYLEVPMVETFNLSFDFMHYKNNCKGYNETFNVIFNYDKYERKGYVLDIVYLDKGGTLLSLKQINNKEEVTVKEETFSFVQKCDVKYNATLTVTKNHFHAIVGECVFDCDITTQKGKVAFSKGEAFREIYLTNLTFESLEIEQEFISEYKVEIPCDNGMPVPYFLQLKLYKLQNNLTKIDYVFGGGLFDRETVKKIPGNCWALCLDDFTGLYFKINDTKRFYLDNGTFRVLDTNYLPKDKLSGENAIVESVNDLYKTIIKVVNEPIEGSVVVKNLLDVEEITVGYNHFVDTMSLSLMGGNREFKYDTKGNLIYNGESLEKEFATSVFSPLNATLESLIPQSVYDRKSVIKHLKYNHYFVTTDKELEFFIDVRSKNSLEDISVKAYLQDAFFNNIEKVEVFELSSPQEYKNSNVKSYGVKLHALPLGVYHVYFEIYYFNNLVKTHRSAFDVIDLNSQVSPQEASGLLSCHSGDGGPIGCNWSVPDFWNPCRDYNYEHYSNIVLMFPYLADERRIWEVYPIFRKKMNSWMNGRCINREDLLNGYNMQMGTTKNFDYFYHPYPGKGGNGIYGRYDFFVYRTFKNLHLGALNDFLNENLDIKKEMGLDNVLECFTLQQYQAFMKKYCTKFIDYRLPQITSMFIEQWKEVKKVNPKAKRFSYGPFNAYISPYSSAYFCKWYGNDPKELSNMYDGYLQFEDYPHDCGYSTTRGAFGLATVKMYDPKVKVHPELYDGWREGCPDSALAPAKPPLGYFYCKPYLCTTQIFEYVFNTAYYIEDKYDYWRDYGLMLFSVGFEDPTEKMDEYITSWGKAKNHLPKNPKKGAVILYEIEKEDDRFDAEHCYDIYSGGDYGYDGHAFHNISATGLAYVYEKIRESGVPVSAITNYQGLESITNENCDILVIPSLKNASDKVKEQIRKLSKMGIPLVSVSNVDGLEDLFGVKPIFKTSKVTSITDGEKEEVIVPTNAEIFYENVSGEVLLKDNNQNAILVKKDNNLLINAPVCHIGMDSFKYAVYNGINNISELLAETLYKTIKDISNNEYFISEVRCGITPYVSQKEEDMILLVEYSKDLQEADYDRARRVKLNIPEGYKDIECVYGDATIGKRYDENNNLSLCMVEILRNQSILLKLVK